VLVELLGATGRAEEPVYPYRTSLDVQRPLALGVLVLAALLAVLGGYDFVVGH
jgi:Asp-tRNA(Asn)/Glu-tRNA(Gln) amidotransferase A subunit family amidase